MNELVSTKWLNDNINDRNLVIFDCSWYLPFQKKLPYKEYKSKHIKGSHFFDIEKFSDKNNKFPHMIPKLIDFKNNIKNFNIHKKSKIITYGYENILGPSRVWWMFKYFGFTNVYVLNGCLNKWIKERRPVTNKKSIKNNSTFKFIINDTWKIDKKKIIENLKNKKNLIFDARNSKRFSGLEKEPRKNLRLGHLPYSKNIFWKEVTKNGQSIISKN